MTINIESLYIQSLLNLNLPKKNCYNNYKSINVHVATKVGGWWVFPYHHDYNTITKKGHESWRNLSLEGCSMLTFLANFMFGHVFKFCMDSRIIGSNGFLVSYRNYLR
jgi:hypothetical protein